VSHSAAYDLPMARRSAKDDPAEVVTGELVAGMGGRSGSAARPTGASAEALDYLNGVQATATAAHRAKRHFLA
jgi:hypothetical protein